MGSVKHHASAEEKLRLIREYLESDESRKQFATKHGLCDKTLKRWLDKLNADGEEALKSRKDKSYEAIAPYLVTEADLRKEILKLRIENERLKKSYTVKTTEDGKMEYIRLKARNMK